MNLSPDTGSRAEHPLPACLTPLLNELDQAGPQTPSHAAALLTALAIDAADLCQWVDFEHPVRDSYGRLLVHGGANYELMVMSWAAGDYSAIHDHGMAEWGAVRYFGTTDHAVFEEHGGQLSLRQRMTMEVGDVCAVDHDLIHLMGNPGPQPFVSLHLYGRNEAADVITGGARIFDLYENRIQRTDGGVFFCLPEADINGREPCPGATPATRRLHHQLMLNRLQRIGTRRQLTPWLKARSDGLLAALDSLEKQQSDEAPP